MGAFPLFTLLLSLIHFEPGNSDHSAWFCRPQGSVLYSEELGSGLSEVLELQNGDALIRSYADPEGWQLPAFRRWLAQHLSQNELEQHALLTRQRDLYKRHGYKDEVRRYDELLAERPSPFGTAGCLEKWLFNRHLEVASFERADEFSALVLQKRRVGGSLHLKIYFNSAAQSWVSSFGSEDLKRRFLSDLKAGWTYRAHLHLHPFFLSPGQSDIAGTVIPSSQDIRDTQRQAERYGLQEYWITNGLTTLKRSVRNGAALRERTPRRTF